jgi:hypothetical protein
LHNIRKTSHLTKFLEGVGKFYTTRKEEYKVLVLGSLQKLLSKMEKEKRN